MFVGFYEKAAALQLTDIWRVELMYNMVITLPAVTMAEDQSGFPAGTGYKKRPGFNECSLHTTPVDTRYLIEYWSNLSREQREMLINMPEEDFISHLDYHLKFILRICRQCRVNVMREFRLLKPGNAGINGKHFFEVITCFHNSPWDVPQAVRGMTMNMFKNVQPERSLLVLSLKTAPNTLWTAISTVLCLCNVSGKCYGSVMFKLAGLVGGVFFPSHGELLGCHMSFIHRACHASVALLNLRVVPADKAIHNHDQKMGSDHLAVRRRTQWSFARHAPSTEDAAKQELDICARLPKPILPDCKTSEPEFLHALQ
jgi:hypothetical protein